MARIRTVKPEFWTSPDVARLSRDARLLFIGTWTVADDHGYLEDDAERLLFQLFPGDRDLEAGDVAGWLSELVARGCLARLEDDDGRALLRVTGFGRHQRIDRPSRSRFAVPEGAAQRSLPVPEPEPEAAPAKSSRRKAKKADPDQLPADFPKALVPWVDPVRQVLQEVADGNGARGVVLPTRLAVAMALADFPRRDFLAVARDYRAWQLGGRVRAPHKDPTRGYRNQLDRAPDVARPTPPGDDRPGRSTTDRTRDALKELEA